MVNESPYYKGSLWRRSFIAIEEHYGDKKAKRSGQPLIKHIHDGIAIMKAIGASNDAIGAYCIHPIVQSDDALKANFAKVRVADGSGYTKNGDREWHLAPAHILLAMEYRWIANLYLSTKKINLTSEIELSPLKEVQDMLIADKVQNRKDFEKYHLGKHKRSEILLRYFKNWLYRLEVSEDRYKELASLEGEWDVRAYFEKRAGQLKSEGYTWSGVLQEVPDLGYETWFLKKGDQFGQDPHFAVYVLPQNRGKGRAKKYIKTKKNCTFLTSKACKTKEFFKKFGIKTVEVGKDWTE